MDIEDMAKRFMEKDGGAALRKLVSSAAGEELSARFGGGAAEEAVRQGDEKRMREILQSVLGTPEGRELAAKVREAMTGHGR